MYDYLRSTGIIDWTEPAVVACAGKLAKETGPEPLAVALHCFEWVRDAIPHSFDRPLSAPVTCTASEVLTSGTGICFAKAHLLAALLRANGIPAGLCYQRFRRNAPWQGFALHGLNAVYLPEWGWYRVDARGNTGTIEARFTPPIERLAFHMAQEGEADLPGVLADPLPRVVAALRASRTLDELRQRLPDAEPATR